MKNKTNSDIQPEVVKNFDVVGLVETMSKNFDRTYLDSFDVYTGKDENTLKGFHGTALMVKKTLQHKFLESGSGLLAQMLKLQMQISAMT